MRNIEIKAKVQNLQNFLDRVKKLTLNSENVINQQDTFYNAKNGRLKLRQMLNNGKAELIYYDRPDTEGPKLSTFKKVDLSPETVPQLHQVLIKALGAKCEVKKTRHLFLVGQTRVHVDEVENLGSFMELEVCLTAEQSLEEGKEIADDLMKKLGIVEEDLVKGAYADLLSSL